MNAAHTCIITCIYQGKTDKSIKVHVKQEGKFFFLPLSQMGGIYPTDEEVEVDAEQLTPGDEILVRIPVWLACKLLGCDGRQELEELALSFLEVE